MTNAAAKRESKARVYSWAETLDVSVNWLGVRHMKNKWASCSTNGNLNFNSELLGLDDDLQDYVTCTSCCISACPITASFGRA